ncbi:MAG: hypothetical protein GY875_12295 [Gammaproteobacteria bacterium]|nr:hypothetical protein [Gammaproteobacteria bacterium]
MSVINNVLKGLESRESQFTPIEIPSVKSAPIARRDYRPALFIVVSLLLVLAAGWYYLQNPFTFTVAQPTPQADEDTQLQSAAAATPTTGVVLNSMPESTTETIPTTESTPQPVARVVSDETPLAANQIAGLQIREAETRLRLEFLLREPVVAYLKNRTENSFSYHLRDIESQIDAPSIRGNRWIREFTIVASEGGVDVNFATAADILVETRQAEQDGETVWVINLRQSQPEHALVAAQVEQAVAAPAPPIAAAEATPAPVEAEPSAPVTLTIKPTNPDSRTTNQLDYAVELMNSRRNEDAEALLRGLLGGTHDYSARKHLLVLYSRVNRPNRLRSLLQASLLEYPQDPLFETEYARRLFAQAAYGEVIELFARRTTLNTDQQALLAASYQRLDQHEAAIRHYQFALQRDAKNARNWVGLGISQEQRAAFVDALASYQQASELGSLNARLQAFVTRRSAHLRQVLN